MNGGHTVKDAFDQANQNHPACFNSQCMRFAGDPNFAVVPVVPRVPPFPSLTKVDDVNDANCVYPWNMIDENYLNYTICYDANGNAANNVIIEDQLPFEVDYYSSDSNGVYDPNSRTVTWVLNDISATDSGCVHITVKVNEFARPGSSFRNYCEMRNDQYSTNATEKTNVCCRGPDIIYVDADANGFNNGTSWQDAYTDLQDALAGASNCDTKNVIKVATGTYKPTKHIWYPHARFQLLNGVAVYGGYPPGGGQRNPDAYQTILSGDIDANSTPDIDYVVRGADDAILDGFTITMGRTGIYFKDCNNLTVANCIISDNISEANGGGIYCQDSNNVTITNCIFTDNTADDYGGGMYNYQASPEVTNCTFNGNLATYGGGISNSGSSPNVTNCAFSDNSANYGGAVFNYSSEPNVINCIFTGNTATSAYGGGMYNSFDSSPTIINCIFSGNTSISWDGGGMYNYQSSPTLINCTFSRNSAGRSGGGMFNWNDSDPNVTNCIFWSNTPAEIEGGSPVITYSDIQGGWLGEGNIDADPCFVDADANNFHLSNPDSPCVDAGTNTPTGGLPATDIDGERRVVDGDANGTEIVDMGADEYYWSPADFNSDGIVNFFDYALFANIWQKTDQDDDYNDVYDLIDNNCVDYNDLARFAEDWLWEAACANAFACGYGQGMGRSMGLGMSESLSLTEEILPSAPAKQIQPQLTEADIEEIIKWLAELWLTEDELRKMMSEEEWQKFIESLKKQI